MGSLTEGSANVASQITEDLKGQILTIDGDLSLTTEGLILTSPDGSTFKITVTNGGTLAATAV